MGYNATGGYGEDPIVTPKQGGYASGVNSSLKLALILITATMIGLATTACQTSKGFGKDVEKLGDKIQEKAS